MPRLVTPPFRRQNLRQNLRLRRSLWSRLSLRLRLSRRPATRALAAGIVLAFGAAVLTGCDTHRSPGDAQYEIVGGNPSGIYYAYAEQLAAAVHRETGIDIAAAESQGSVENLERVASGEALFGFAQGDTAADALLGRGSFSDPLPVSAVARVYDEYVHVVVPADSELLSLTDLAGRTVSLGARGSGVQVIADRVLAASGVDRSTVRDEGLGLDDSIAALERGDIDAFFWVGGIPTPGIEELAGVLPIRLLSIDAEVVERANDENTGVYRPTDFPVGFYALDESTVTMTVPNYFIANADAPDALVKNVLRVLFHSRATISDTVTAAGYLDRRRAIFTGPIELHPGAAEYYVETRK